MPILNFKEIPEAHKASGEQDTFELFARDFLEFLGYKVLREPSRGADGGCDLLVEETRKGIAGETKIKWLVSCKHKAHSGSSVGKSDEPEIKDSVTANGCGGFIGFYSTISSSGLLQKLEKIEGIEHQVFDSSRIEQVLLTNEGGKSIAKRYFPVSIGDWEKENPAKAQIFSGAEGLKCKNCGEDITEGRNGIIVIWEKYQHLSEPEKKRKIKDLYWCCRGDCDFALKHRYRERDYLDTWEDIHDLRIPTVYIRWVMASLNRMQEKYEYSESAVEANKELLLQLFPYVARNLTSSELERVQSLGQIPSFLGGLGYNA